jgi:hypothetical protein
MLPVFILYTIEDICRRQPEDVDFDIKGHV